VFFVLGKRDEKSKVKSKRMAREKKLKDIFAKKIPV